MVRYVLDARTATNHFPGIGRYVFNLAQAMIPQLLTTEKLTLLQQPNQPSRWDLTMLSGVQVDVVDVAISPFSLRQQWRIPALLKKLSAALYHSPYFLMPYRPGIPTILTIYDFIPLNYPQYSTLQARLLSRWTTALSLRAATHSLVISKATLQDLLRYYKVNPASVTPTLLAADPAYCPQSPEVIAALQERLGLPKHYILYLGSNKPHKNLVRLVEAWAHTQPTNQTLVIAGVWDDRYPEAKTIAKSLHVDHSVLFLGAVQEKDLPALYSGASLFVFPSEIEGFGLPVLEAMACGIPVICSNISSLPEIAGTAALQISPTDVVALSKAISKVLHNPQLQTDLGQRSLSQAQQFSWQRTAQITLEVYRNVLAS